MIFHWALKLFSYIWKVTSGFKAKSLINTNNGILIGYVPLTTRNSCKYLVISWFVKESWFFDLLSLFLDLFLMFCNSLLILKESLCQAKWQRNLGFGTYFLFIITHWLQLRLFENLANQAAKDRIQSKY